MSVTDAQVAAFLPCSQCGQRLTDRACGPTHAILTAEPARHRLLAPLIERERRAAKVEALREAAERINAVCPYGEGDVPYANDIHLQMWADEIERGDVSGVASAAPDGQKSE